MIVLLVLLGLLSSTFSLSLLELHEDRFPLRTYTKDNVLNNEDGTISLTEYPDDDYTDGQRTHQSIPIIEAPVAMSNPIFKIFSRANDLYRIIRRSYEAKSQTISPGIIQDSTQPTPYTKKPMKNPRGWQLFLR